MNHDVTFPSPLTNKHERFIMTNITSETRGDNFRRSKLDLEQHAFTWTMLPNPVVIGDRMSRPRLFLATSLDGCCFVELVVGNNLIDKGRCAYSDQSQRRENQGIHEIEIYFLVMNCWTFHF
jgi:hypothetical protein